MLKGVERIERAIANKERIAIHGDYDVDGITSTVILRRALRCRRRGRPLHPERRVTATDCSWPRS
jgi:single-stranded-DNA-specific exonuclease